MHYKISPLILICSLLAGCASPQTEMIAAQAKESFAETAEVNGTGIDVELINNDSLTEKEKNTAIDAAIEESASECTQIYPQTYALELNKASADYRTSGSKAALYQLPQKAVKLDQQFSKCLNKYGLKGRFVIFGKNGKYWSAPDHLLEFIKRGEVYQATGTQLNIEREENRRLWLQALSAAAVAASNADAKVGNCTYTWQRAADGSRCGDRAAVVRPNN